jgi:hypothetical protein
MPAKNSEGLTNMKKGEAVERHYKNDTMYEVYDKTDPAHCIFIGLFDTLEEAAKAAKRHKESFPNAEIWAYEMIRED